MGETEAAPPKRRWWPWIILGACSALVVLLVVVAGTYYFWIVRPVVQSISYNRNEANKLLGLNNHAQVLADCRKMMADKAKFKNLPYVLPGSPDWQLVPTSVKALNPTMVVLEVGEVIIEKGGGFHHFGLKALPQGSLQKFQSDTTDNWKELVPGLWYYEEKDGAAVL